jgi:hypothetical protein
VLVMLSVTLLLVTLALAATAKVTQLLMGRLRLDSTTVLLWLGLAEWPTTRSPQQRRKRHSFPVSAVKRTTCAYRYRTGSRSRRRAQHGT